MIETEILTAKDVEFLPCILSRKSPPYKYSENREKLKKLSLKEKIWKRDFFDCDAYCILCGEISNNVECIDFDQQAEMFADWAKSIDKNLLEKLYIESTLKGGKHVIYHCLDGIEENKKLAYNEKGQICIETRGNGGLVLTAPTPNYKTLQGDIRKIPYISADERKQLIDNALKLNRNSVIINNNEKRVYVHSEWQSSPEWLVEPITDFNNRFDLQSFLIANGWSIYSQNKSDVYFTRPGKEDGISATWNGETFYVFSSNVVELDSEKGYNPFQVFSHYLDKGNMAETYKRIIGAGYGKKRIYEFNENIFKNIKRRIKK